LRASRNRTAPDTIAPASVPSAATSFPGSPPSARKELSLDGFSSVIFDLDGVLTDTASLHRQAWRETFTAYFEAETARTGSPIAVFTDEDYEHLVDGRLRVDGARAVLEDRGLLGWDRARSSLDADAEAVAAKKDKRYQQLLDTEGPHPYPSSLELLATLRAARFRVAVVTGSLHAAEVLRLVGIEDDVDALVDGRAAAAMHLAGKPSPDTLCEAATRLGVTADRCLVIDDAVAGVAAGVRGGFRVLGVDRAGHRDALIDAGAMLVVCDLGDLDLVGSAPNVDPCLLYDPDTDDEQEGVRESLFSLGNGVVATRAARSYVHDDGHHYPGCYLAGVFDRLIGNVEAGRIDEDAIVNAPNWLAFSFAVGHGPTVGSDEITISHHWLELDLGRGVLARSYETIDGAGRKTSVLERRFVSMADPHLVAIELSLVARNWSGRLEIRAGLDGTVTDDETVEEHLLGAHHLELVEAGDEPPEGAYLVVRTTQSRVLIAEVLRARLLGAASETQVHHRRARVARTFIVEMSENQRVTCEKVVAIHTSRDAATSDPLDAGREAVRRAGTFAELLASHEAAWARLWSQARVDVHDDTTAVQRLLNFHLFHVLQVASPHVIDHDVGLPARGLAGEGYLGHIFWDELFILPMLNRSFPATARSFLAYRARRLERARLAAADEGHRGAMFPWQSASDGRDETPRALYNPRSGHWIEDRSRYQRHIGLAVAYNFWQYFESTGDQRHLCDTGAEVILEVARYFADLARLDTKDGRYHIEGVMGPDEFHDAYPWRDTAGVDDNAYTNVMTAWLLERAIDVVDLVRQSGEDSVLERIGFVDDELAHFVDVSRRLYVPFIGEVISQFEGYERLEALDLDAYRQRYGDLGRLDLILESEGDSVRRYQVGKQPDVLMLLYLFSAEELRNVLGRLGYDFDADAIRKTVEFYSARVTHGSSLSRVVQAWIAARLDRTSSWQYLSEALEVDVRDVNRGTTREGIHLGAMAGTVDIFERCYPGLEMRADALWLNPALPEEL
jgi:HAD superfamily hydrolase (TIGR01509 family)